MKPPQNKGYDWQSGLKIGGEMKKAAIKKLRKRSPLAGSFEWSGTILPGTLGPNPPEARMSGWTKGVWGNDGLYLHIQGDYQATVDEMSGSFWKLDFQDDMRIES